MIIDNQEVAVRHFGYPPTLHDAELHSIEIVGTTGLLRLIYCDLPAKEEQGVTDEVHAILDIEVVGITEFKWPLGGGSVYDYALEPQGQAVLMTLTMNDGSTSRIAGKALRYVGCRLVSPAEVASLECTKQITVLQP